MIPQVNVKLAKINIILKIIFAKNVDITVNVFLMKYAKIVFSKIKINEILLTVNAKLVIFKIIKISVKVIE